MKRIALVVLVLAAAACALMLAWRVVSSGQRQWAKERIKAMLGMDSRTHAVPAAALAQEYDAAGRVTGDDPPFAFASGPWSAVMYAAGEAVIRPNLRFDFEMPQGMDTSRLSRDWAHSGAHAYRMGPSDEYSPVIRRRVGDVASRLSAIEFGLWMWAPSAGTVLTAVVSIDREGKQLAWFGKDLQSDADARHGQRANGHFPVLDLDLRPDDLLSAYFWKRGGTEAFIDDVDLYFHNAEIPGRAAGKALALDSLRPDGPQPLRYARISVTDLPVDQARCRIGGPAQATTLEPVPIGGTQRYWRFAPQQGLAWLQDAEGTPLALIRPWSQAMRRDITHFDRVVAAPLPQGLLLTGYDVVRRGQEERIAAHPAPMALQIGILAE